MISTERKENENELMKEDNDLSIIDTYAYFLSVEKKELFKQIVSYKTLLNNAEEIQDLESFSNYNNKYFETYYQLKKIMSEKEFNKTLAILINHKLMKELFN